MRQRWTTLWYLLPIIPYKDPSSAIKAFRILSPITLSTLNSSAFTCVIPSTYNYSDGDSSNIITFVGPLECARC